MQTQVNQIQVNAPVVIAINDYPENQFNRLFPYNITQLSPLQKVMVNIVKIDENPGNGEVYKQSSGFALTKNACLKLMTAANVVMESSQSILPNACNRCKEIAIATRIAPQCGTCPTREDAAYKVSILVPEPSGGVRRYIATKEISKEQFIAANGGSKAPIQHMAAQCETKALLRALRAGLGIKGVYSVAELKKPFAVAVVVLNAHDPDLKAAMIEQFSRGQTALFGSAQPQIALPNSNVGLLTDGALPGDILINGDDDLPPGAIDVDKNTGEVDYGDELPPTMGDVDPLICINCGIKVSDRVKTFSEQNYGGTYCVQCQKAVGTNNAN